MRGKHIFSGPRLRLRIWSGETDLAVPSRVSPHILHTQAEHGAYLIIIAFTPISPTTKSIPFTTLRFAEHKKDKKRNLNKYEWICRKQSNDVSPPRERSPRPLPFPFLWSLTKNWGNNRLFIIIAISIQKRDRRTDCGLLSYCAGIVRCSSQVSIVLCVLLFFSPRYVCWHTTMFKKNLNASKPSEHPPSGEKLSKYLRENIGCRDKNSLWYQKGSPM